MSYFSLSDFRSVRSQMFSKMLTSFKLFYSATSLFAFFPPAPPITPDCFPAVQNGSSEWVKKKCVCVQLAPKKKEKKEIKLKKGI